MTDILAKLNQKRKVLNDQELRPDMRQRNVRMCPTPSKVTKTDQGACNGEPGNGGATNPNNDTTASETTANQDKDTGASVAVQGGTTNGEASDGVAEAADTGTQGRTKGRKGPRQGPCVFGCRTTTNIKKGVQVWRNPPKP